MRTAWQKRLGSGFYRKTALGIVDCLGEVLGVGDFERVLEHSVELELPFGNCRILDLDALIRAKEAMNRDHDRLTARQLREIKRRQQPPQPNHAHNSYVL